ncbi:MAG: hypothetical protein WC405_20605 [Syntrophales bacterium]
MHAEKKLICRRRGFMAPLLILAVMLWVAGCGTSSLKGYQASFQNSSGARVNTQDWKIEHNLFGGQAQHGKEDWEDD